VASWARLLHSMGVGCQVIARRAKPPWQVLWRAGPPAPWVAARSRPRWQVRLMQLQAGWKLLWAERLRRDLDPIYRLVACRRGRQPSSFRGW
jgi:hypothetical protein